ncbi:ROK family protein [Nonomuraea sp. NPDC049504]|uniref:ROK family protein n=1 Tax=Nonomuraea sp. NPDC049504 TaxID=3154729 RepID=UPI00343683CD
MILAIDVGGTKLAAGLVSRDGTVTGSRRVATPQGADAETLWRTLIALVEPLAGHAEAVGVGCGGPMSWPDGEVSPLNIPGWRRFPLRARLAEQFPSLPVRLHNDAVCLAVAEHWLGAGRGSRDMLGMVVSTGVGGGLILGGRLAHGRTGNAGHIGHVVVEPHDGPRCTCGGHGCLEAVARGPALTSWALANGWHPNPRKPPAPVPAPITAQPNIAVGLGAAGGEPGWSAGTHVRTAQRAGEGAPHANAAVGRVLTGSGPDGEGVAYREGREAAGSGPDGERVAFQEGREAAGSGLDGEGVAYREDREVTARELAADALAGDPVAVRAMRRAGRALGVAIASATHLCDLGLVTVGGGLAQAGEPLFGPLEEALREHARMGFARDIEVLPAALGQDAGLVGAAALHLAADRYWPT